MDWKEIQSEWKKDGENEQTEFSIPTEKKMEKLNKELKFYHQEWGKSPSIAMSAIYLFFALLLLIGSIWKRENTGEGSPLEFLILVFVPLAISNIARAWARKKISPDKDLLKYLKAMRRDVQWVRFQQYGMAALFLIMLPFTSLFRDAWSEGFASLEILLILLLPIGIIGGALLWMYRNHYPYRLAGLNKSLKNLIDELKEENEEKI